MSGYRHLGNQLLKLNRQTVGGDMCSRFWTGRCTGCTGEHDLVQPFAGSMDPAEPIGMFSGQRLELDARSLVARVLAIKLVQLGRPQHVIGLMLQKGHQICYKIILHRAPGRWQLRRHGWL